jgi:hypothetical protein
MLPLGEQFVLWALRQWQREVAKWNAKQTLPEGGSVLQRGFDLARMRPALPHFAMLMDTVLCGLARPIEIHPPPAPILSPDEALLVALCGLAQGGLEGPLQACLSAMLPPESCRMATVQLKLFAVALGEAGLGSAPPICGAGGWLH